MFKWSSTKHDQFSTMKSTGHKIKIFELIWKWINMSISSIINKSMLGGGIICVSSSFLLLWWRHLFHLYLLSFCMITHMISLEGSGTFDVFLVLSLWIMYVLSGIFWSLVMLPLLSSRVLLFYVHTYIYPLVFHNKLIVYITVN